MAFPGSMFGALLCGITFSKCKKIMPTLLAEVFGTSILRRTVLSPGCHPADGTKRRRGCLYAYIIPFLVSTAGGAVLSGVFSTRLHLAAGQAFLKNMQAQLAR